MQKISVYDNLALLFQKHGYHLFVVGGTTRDYLLKFPLKEFDLATDATPKQMANFLLEADYRFSLYGTVRLKIEGYQVDITTLREEASYKDYRHPQSISFIKEIQRDYIRRDFTINALYIDQNYQIHDFCGGIDDLNQKIIRTIGEPNLRIQEDPLRMLRALRFKFQYAFKLEENLEKAIFDNHELLEYLNREKVNAEIKKMTRIDEEGAQKVLISYGIKTHY